MNYLPYVGVLTACAIAIVTDLRARKIPNAIPIALGIFALVVNASMGRPTFFSGLAAGAILLLLGMVPFAMGWLGGGDVKLLAAAACALGLSRTLPLVLFTAVAGGVLAIVAAVISGQTQGVFTGVRRMVTPWLYPGVASAGPTTGLRLPYAIAIASGVVLLLIGDRFVPALRVV
jgi:prepilin peptidase CpaA